MEKLFLILAVLLIGGSFVFAQPVPLDPSSPVEKKHPMNKHEQPLPHGAPMYKKTLKATKLPSPTEAPAAQEDEIPPPTE